MCKSVVSGPRLVVIHYYLFFKVRGPIYVILLGCVLNLWLFIKIIFFKIIFRIKKTSSALMSKMEKLSVVGER